MVGPEAAKRAEREGRGPRGPPGRTCRLLSKLTGHLCGQRGEAEISETILDPGQGEQLGRDKVWRAGVVVGGEGGGQVDFLEEVVSGLGLGGLRRREEEGKKVKAEQEQAQRLSRGQLEKGEQQALRPAG